MSIELPVNPVNGDIFIAAGKQYVWSSPSWRRAYNYAIIDGGLSNTEVITESETADGGNA